MILLSIGSGGALGALTRYWLEGKVAPRQKSPFPLSTLLINASGSTALGLLAGFIRIGSLPGSAIFPLGIGFLGGYTTFSTFTYETVRLMEDRAWTYAILNLALSAILSFGGAAMGYYLVMHL